MAILFFKGYVNFNNLTVGTTATIHLLDVITDIHVDNVSVSSNLDTAKRLSSKNLFISETSVLIGYVTMNGILNINNNTICDANVTITGILINENTIDAHNTVLANILYVSSDSTFKSNIITDKHITVNNKANINDAIMNKTCTVANLLYVSGDTILNTATIENLTINSILFLKDKLNVNDIINVKDISSVGTCYIDDLVVTTVNGVNIVSSNDMTVHNNINILNDCQISKNLTAENITTTTLISTGNLTIISKLFTSDLSTLNNVIIPYNLTVLSSSNLNKTIISDELTTSTILFTRRY